MSTAPARFCVAVTGHRPDKLGGYRPNPTLHHVQTLLTTVVERLQTTIPTLHAISGMALGVDQLYARICVTLQIPFFAYIPFHGQERRWPQASQQEYHALLDRAVAVHCTEPRANQSLTYDEVRAALLQRNADMITDSHAAIAVWNGSPGGTAHAVGLLRQQRIPCLLLHPTKPLDLAALSDFVEDCRRQSRSTA